MLLHPLAHRLRRDAFAFIERRHVGRRWRRRRAEKVVEHPFAADHGRGSIAVRRDRENAALTEQAAARLVGDADAAEVAAV